MPQGLKRWLGKRFDKDEAILENGAAFDMVRAAVNLSPIKSATKAFCGSL